MPTATPKLREVVPHPRICLCELPLGQEAWEVVPGAERLRDLLFLLSTGNGLTAKRLCTVTSCSITAQAEVSRKQIPGESLSGAGKCLESSL